jgi:hypothetical protein
MTSRSTLRTCAHCRQPFPVVEGRVQQWRVGGETFACNEFCAEAVESRATSPSAS